MAVNIPDDNRHDLLAELKANFLQQIREAEEQAGRAMACWSRLAQRRQSRRSRRVLPASNACRPFAPKSFIRLSNGRAKTTIIHVDVEPRIRALTVADQRCAGSDPPQLHHLRHSASRVIDRGE